MTDSSYVISTKLPALGTIFNRDYSGWSLSDVSKDIQAITGEPASKVKPIIEGSTGFTNFYKAYRNSSLDWIRANRSKISAILKDTYSSESDNQGVLIAEKISSLSPIPSPSGERAAHPEYLLSPLCFCLDPNLRFPIINGSVNVVNLLREFDVNKAKLAVKYSALVSLLGSKGVKDAADLDQLRKWDSKEIQQLKNKFKLVTPKSRDLPPKDADDYEVLKKNLSVKAKRIHNDLTNQLLRVFIGKGKIVEGSDQKCRYDALVTDYDGMSDLLIEVKSSTEISDVRMAIGQLLDYHRQLDNRDKVDMAVLLPKEPEANVKDLLRYAEIRLLWFKGNQLAGTWW
ncbi:MAG: hypothetical protein PHP57_12995 [Sideroxydans sp.]|nr:hypothetical protein [Sideroxydans sp.]